MKSCIFFLLLMPAFFCQAQTDIDGIMMGKNQFCVGPTYTYSSWESYWEGSLKRENLNLGTVTTQTIAVMGNYGIGPKLNVLFNVPYIKTKASAGTLSGMQGVQDLSLFVKWMPLETNFAGGLISLYGVLGGSAPLTNYVADFLPLSIGIRSRSVSGRLIADYQAGNFFVTGSGTYVLRDNIKIDRDAYYTTQAHLTNEVYVPNAANFNLRAGFRNSRLIAEALVNSWKTLGGFDISRNNMPSPGNEMNATAIGANVKWFAFPALSALSIGGSAMTTVTGRNAGQSAVYNGSIFYIFDFSRKKTASTSTSTAN